MKLTEAEKKEFMTKDEMKWKKRLIALLKDDGRGHHHALFAKRLEDFVLKIIYDDAICPTASISFDDGVININHGFLDDNNPGIFRQLSVLMRHEMSHNLLMHQVRMVRNFQKKYGKTGETRISLSNSIHELINIIEDYEISNTRYTSEDKDTVRNMWLNGKLIGGLVTEDERDN